MYYVYILYSSKDKKLYIGYSPNLKSRVKAHNSGFVKSTKHRRPLKLIYYEAYIDELDARKREKFLKGGNGRKDTKVQLLNTFKRIRYNFRE